MTTEINVDFLPVEITVRHCDWFSTVTSGELATYYDTPLQARNAAKRQGYRFDRIEKTDRGLVQEVFKKAEVRSCRNS